MFQTALALITAVTAFADSSNVRWTARPDNALRVWIGGAAHVVAQDADYVDAVRQAFREWNRVGLPFRFRFASDSTSADVRVTWIDHFDRPMSGRTTTLDDDSRIFKADMLLAVNHWDGRRLTVEEMRVLALHEIGHALGLAHSTDPRSVMSPVVRVRRISDADRSAARRRYESDAANAAAAARH